MCVYLADIHRTPKIERNEESLKGRVVRNARGATPEDRFVTCAQMSEKARANVHGGMELETPNNKRTSRYD